MAVAVPFRKPGRNEGGRAMPVPPVEYRRRSREEVERRRRGQARSERGWSESHGVLVRGRSEVR